jgi:protein-S-isoprenylcysteine O-methyltransferase Ste14
MGPPFHSFWQGVVFWGILILVVAAVVVMSVNQRAGDDRAPRRRQETSSARRIAVAMLLAIGVGMAFAFARIGQLPNWLFYPGETLFVGGAALTGWSYAILGRHVSPHVQVLPEHTVIKSGPYRYIRHPGYLGQILALAGLGLAMQSWLAELTILLVTVVMLRYRIRVEEEFLVAELGDIYIGYMKATRRFIPFVW